MTDYDFSQLSPHDFELMCRDLLQEEEGLRLESFKSGKDSGIDFRYAPAGVTTIVQCKRFVETGYSGLLRSLRHEAEKVQRLAPQRYILMTAASLSPANKDEIVGVIGPQFLTTCDIFGRSELNGLLGRHPEVERAHYKLWLASINVLEAVLHNDILLQSGFQVKKIYREMRRYVQGSAYPRAMKALDTCGVVILSGQPGVGKTTLADLILYEHLAREFEPVIIRENFAEGKKLFRQNRPQIFYFDDFMGVTFLGDKGSAGQQRDYRAIVEFIEMIGTAKDKRLVLTTRDHMFQQAWGASEQLRDSGIIDHKLVIHMGDYSLQQRAEILYNHLFFSDLPPGYRDELLKDEFYFNIVKHNKFNPRLIEWLSTQRRLKGIAVDGYQAFVTNLLENPAEIWRHAYEQQISDAGRSLLLTLSSFGGRAGEALLREGFGKLHEHRAQKYGLQRRPDDYIVARKELNGAFIMPMPNDMIEFINPSVQDWLNSVVREAPENAVDLILGACRFTQLSQVWGFVRSDLGGASRDTLSRQLSTLVPKIVELATAPRTMRQRDGSTAYLAPTYELRLAKLIEIADEIRVPDALVPIERLIKQILVDRKQEHCPIDDMITAMHEFQESEWSALACFSSFFDKSVDELMASAREHCRSGELRNLLLFYEASSADQPMLSSEHHPLRSKLLSAYTTFVWKSLPDELSECTFAGDYEELLSDLEYFYCVLRVDVSAHVSRVAEARDEYLKYEEQHADQEMDSYKESARESHDDDDNIRAMFGSLGGSS
ncbi:restriction endonuclease [Acetobacter sp.]|uniref:nSTAND3 domain-containing NTPase n=1 Tax=Acetobacter sp. TaxID=440 RepID=UPI0039EBC4CC